MKDYDYKDGAKLPARTEVTEYDELQRKSGSSVVDGTDNPVEAQIKQNQTTYRYDAWNRLETMNYPKKDGIVSQTFVYNADGWLTKVTGTVKGNGEQTLRDYAYNNMGEVATVQDNLGYLSEEDRKLIKNYEYDASGRVVKLTYADSEVVERGNPVTRQSSEHQYDKKSQIISETQENEWRESDSSRFRSGRYFLTCKDI